MFTIFADFYRIASLQDSARHARPSDWEDRFQSRAPQGEADLIRDTDPRRNLRW